jgi:hypothetical protein
MMKGTSDEVPFLSMVYRYDTVKSPDFAERAVKKFD